MLKLLLEQSDSIGHLVEAKDGGDSQYIIEGYFLQAEAKNRNGRIYPRNVMESAVNAYQSEYISQGRAIGEFIHPTYPMPNPKEAALLVKELKWDGDNVYGKAVVLDNPYGNQIKSLIKGGFKGGVSSRGLGSLSERNGINYVNDDYVINAIDYVDMPSGQVCYVSALAESVGWKLDKGLWVQQANSNVCFDELVENFKKILLKHKVV